MKGQLNMLRLTITVLFTNINNCSGVQHLFDIASLHLSLFTSSAPTKNSDKFDLRTTHYNLVQDNTDPW